MMLSRNLSVLLCVAACSSTPAPNGVSGAGGGDDDDDTTTTADDPFDDGSTRGLVLTDEAPEPLEMTPPLEFAIDRYARRIAVVIGVDDYRGTVPKLRFAVSDARHMAKLLEDFGFEVVATLEDQDATREGILRLLGRTLAKTVGPEDLVVVFFAGHGVTVGELGYILPSDATGMAGESGISVQELKDNVLRWRNKHTMFLLDACFSGAMFRRPEPGLKDNPLAYWQAISDQRLVEIVTAGDEDELVIERDGWGVFTRSLHEGLRGAADADGDGVVSGMELAMHASAVVPKTTGNRQHPQWGTVEGAGTVLFWDARRVPERQVRLTRSLTIADREADLARVHELLDRREFGRAERTLRKLILADANPILNLTLAELYLEQDPKANASLAEAELAIAEEATLDGDAERVYLELRARVEKAKRGQL